MKKISAMLISAILLAFSSCNTEPSANGSVKQTPVNYMVLLDLSDRLISPGQSERDIEIIKTVFSEFSRTVRQNLVINSADKFQVIIAPQKGIPYNAEEYENSLFIDMGSLGSGVKLNEMVEFEGSLPSLLQDLYSRACLGSKTSNYPGTGMWQFFNESLGSLAEEGYQNNLVILTDGYFDLEDYSRQLPEGRRYPTTSFLSEVRNKADWKMMIEKNDMGLIPVKKEFPGIRIIVAEINPKYDFQYESDMLVYIWKKWCTEMKTGATEVLVKTSLPQTANLMRTKLSVSLIEKKTLLSKSN